jgi:hypothetical protein
MESEHKSWQFEAAWPGSESYLKSIFNKIVGVQSRNKCSLGNVGKLEKIQNKTKIVKFKA